MKRIFTLLVAVLLTASVFAQSPEKMSYQAVIRNASDELVISQAVGMQISILQGAADGTAVYVETQTPTTNANGLVTVEIGDGTTTDDFSAIDWANDIYFIKTETDPVGGNNYTIVGTSQLLSVPYALHAKTAKNTFSGDYEDLTNKPNISGTGVQSDWNAEAGTGAEILNKPSLATVATSGNYNDLTNTPNLSLKANTADVYTKLQTYGQEETNSFLGQKQDILNKNAANGYAGIDNNGKILASQLPESIMGGLDYAGTLESAVTGLKSANKLPPANALNKGQYYKISIAGDYEVEGETMALNAGDWIISNGEKWEVIESIEIISSVNGKIGAVELTADDIPETTARKYFSQVEKAKLESIEAGARNYQVTTDIDDQTTSPGKLWSSTKTNSELDKKANTTDIYTKANLQTAEQAQINYANITGAPDLTNYLTQETDGDVTNELQTMSITGNVITLSDGGTVTLPAVAVGFDGKFTSLTDVPADLSDGDDNTQLTETQVDEYVSNNGYITEDTNTQLTETQVDEFVANNGYITEYTDTKLTETQVDEYVSNNGYITEDTNTQLTETQVDGFVANNGYITEDTNTQLTETQVDEYVSNNGYITEDTNTQLTETQVDNFVANNDYLTSGDISEISVSAASITLTSLSPVAVNGSYNDLTDKPVADAITDAGSGQIITNVERTLLSTVGTMNVLTKAERNALTNVVNGTVIYCSDIHGTGLGELQIKIGEEWKNISPVSLPEAETTAISDITKTTATSGGNIINDGGAEITARGVCWSTTSSSTIADNKTTDGTSIGTFTSSFTGLTPETTYYVRAYATNSVGTAYGTELSFATLAIVLPTLTTTAISDITATVATSGGSITDNGGADITACGVCWSTTENPTIVDTKTEDGTGAGSFTSSITGLTNETTYYVKAYATNSVGTAYGEEVSFTTPILVVLPTLTTTAVSDTTATTATSGGNITNDGGGTITAHGVCWSTTPNPTIVNSITEEGGASVGSFTSSITGLTSGITYYVRAYATNSAGTVYGNQINVIKYGSFTDSRDSKTYKTIKMGSQTWMAENLAYLPSVSPSANVSYTEPYYYVYNYQGISEIEAKATSNYSNYGVLYNWSAAMGSTSSSNTNPSGVQGACPNGWHLPSDAEWTELNDYLTNNGYGYEGSGTDIGKSMATGWWSNVGTAGDVGNDLASNNISGFSAVSCGFNAGGTFTSAGQTCYWWSSYEAYLNNAYFRKLTSGDNYLYRSFDDENFGRSVRCLKD